MVIRTPDDIPVMHEPFEGLDDNRKGTVKESAAEIAKGFGLRFIPCTLRDGKESN